VRPAAEIGAVGAHQRGVHDVFGRRAGRAGARVRWPWRCVALRMRRGEAAADPRATGIVLPEFSARRRRPR
jgi:hypothetical protein